MNTIAFIVGTHFIYCSGVITAMAAATAALLFAALYLGKTGNARAVLIAIPMAVLLGMVLSRLCHWYSRPNSYDGLLSALIHWETGEFALMGGFAGCLLTAVILRKGKVVENIWLLLDCMSIAGCAGIALGRLAAGFTSADRGQVMENPNGLFASAMVNGVSGAAEYRFATFAVQALVAGCLLCALLWLYWKPKKQLPPGDLAILFAMVYGASQVVLDSTRYDSLYLRSNGFISIVQILGAAALVSAIVIYSLRLVKAQGVRKPTVCIWVSCLVFFGGAGYMEYHVQRHGNQAVMAYSVMTVCLVVVVSLGVMLWLLGARQEKTEN